MSAGVLARATFLDQVRQPALWLLAGGGVLLMASGLVFGMFTFQVQDRIRLLSTGGLASGTMLALLLAVLGATRAVRDEIQDRTALVLLVRPVGRAAVLGGKWLGVLGACLAVLLPLAGLHLLALWIGWRAGFEFDLPGRGFDPDAVVPWWALVEAHILLVFQAMIFSAMACVLALRCGLGANLLVCAGTWVGMHLLAGGTGVHGLLVLPALPLLTLDDALQGVAVAPGSAYLVAAGLYSACFCAGWLLTGVALLERQDIT